MTSSADDSAGYQEVADEFIALRSASRIGAGAVEEWAARLPPGSAVLDLGCGHGVPVSEVLIQAGQRVYGVDASPTLVAAFRSRFPEVEVECARVQDSHFFGGSFQGVVAWGLIFLLSPDEHGALIRKVAGVLDPGGEFLFTAPWQEARWEDVLAGGRSVSLGAERYRSLLEEAGLELLDQGADEGGNHYFRAVRLPRAG